MIKTFEQFINENFIDTSSKSLANKLKRDINEIVDLVDGEMENMDIYDTHKGEHNHKSYINLHGKKYTIYVTYDVLSQDEYVLNRFVIEDDAGVQVSNEWIGITEDDYPWIFAVHGSDEY
jgi:hypothetical protein